MSIKFKVFVLSLAVLLLAGQGAFVSAQEEGPPRVCYALLALSVVSLGYDTKSLPK
jgi:hypothetical protein